MLTDEEIRALFLVLQAGGCRLPDAHRGPNGLDAAVSVYALTLEGLTFAEVQAAAFEYLRGTCPFWPTPGQLIERVPYMSEARDSYRALVDGKKRPTLLEVAVLERVGKANAAAYEQAFRQARRLLADMPKDERQRTDPAGRLLPGFSDAFLSQLPQLLTTNQDPNE